MQRPMGQFDLTSLIGMATNAANQALQASNTSKVLNAQAKALQAQAAAATAAAQTPASKPAFFGLNPVFVIGAIALGAFLFLGKRRR